MISPWGTILCVLELDIDTVTIIISVPVANMESLRDTLSEWPSYSAVASEAELRLLIGRLLPKCELLRPGKHCFRCVLNHVGLPPFREWDGNFHELHMRATAPRIPLGPQFHPEVFFWHLLVAGRLSSPAGRFSTPSTVVTYSRPRLL